MNEITEFKKLINKKLFYEAHEALEEWWFPRRKTKDALSLVLKGFINAAVSMELYKRDKIEQSKKIHKVYLKYVRDELIMQTDYCDEFKSLKEFIDGKFESLKICEKRI